MDDQQRADLTRRLLRDAGLGESRKRAHARRGDREDRSDPRRVTKPKRRATLEPDHPRAFSIYAITDLHAFVCTGMTARNTMQRLRELHPESDWELMPHTVAPDLAHPETHITVTYRRI